jgi:hypothetical protein
MDRLQCRIHQREAGGEPARPTVSEVEIMETGPKRDEPDAEEPAIPSGEPPVAAGIAAGLYVGRTEEREADNDQESHVSPPDNDGETVPRDDVVDHVGG